MFVADASNGGFVVIPHHDIFEVPAVAPMMVLNCTEDDSIRLGIEDAVVFVPFTAKAL